MFVSKQETFGLASHGAVAVIMAAKHASGSYFHHVAEEEIFSILTGPDLRGPERECHENFPSCSTI